MSTRLHTIIYITKKVDISCSVPPRRSGSAYLSALYVPVCGVRTCLRCAYLSTVYVPVCAVRTCLRCMYLSALCVPVYGVRTCLRCMYLSVVCVPVCAVRTYLSAYTQRAECIDLWTRRRWNRRRGQRFWRAPTREGSLGTRNSRQTADYNLQQDIVLARDALALQS